MPPAARRPPPRARGRATPPGAPAARRPSATAAATAHPGSPSWPQSENRQLGGELVDVGDTSPPPRPGRPTARPPARRGCRSARRPRGSGWASRVVVVCRPLASRARTSPVAMISSPSRAFTNEDLPAPDSPTSTNVRPAMRSRTPSMPWSSTTEAVTTSTPGWPSTTSAATASAVVDEVGLGQHDRRHGAGVPRERHEPVDAAGLHRAVEPAHDEHAVDVGGELLGVVVHGRSAGQQRGAGQHRHGRPVGHGHPVADGRGPGRAAGRTAPAGRRRATPG